MFIGNVNEMELKQVDLNQSDREISNRYMKSQKHIILFSYLLLILWLFMTSITVFNVDTLNLYQYEYRHEVKVLGYILILLMIIGDVGTLYWFEKINREIGAIIKNYISISDDGIASLKTYYYNIALDFKVSNVKELKPISFKATWSLYMYMSFAFNIMILFTMIIILIF